MSDIEHFLVDFQSSDDKEIDAILIRLQDDAHTLEDVQTACKQYSVRARLMRGEEVVGWVDPAGLFSPDGTQLDPPPAK